MNLIKPLIRLGTGLLIGTAAVSGAYAQKTPEPIKIGVPMPLTGPLAQGGKMILAGIKFAADEANKQGGLYGRPIELLIEDTKSEPNTAAAVASKMVAEDKVFAFAGGYGSTADYAMLQSIKRYKPIFIHMASSAARIETTFGPEPWYYHVYIWDYHRQKAAAAFFNSIKPHPSTVAIAYEDGLYGSDAVKYAQKYLQTVGMKIVMQEPFRTGSPDLSPILNRVKALDPDVFFFIGYSGDSIQMARQEASLGIKTKLSMIVASGEKRADFGAAGDGLAVIGEWAPQQQTPGVQAFIDRIQPTLPAGTEVLPTVVQGYTGMETLIEAMRKAGSLDHDKVLAALDTTTFKTPYGDVSYKPSEGGAKHQLLTDQTLIVWQYRKQGQEVVWPPAKANGKLVYPAR